MAEHRAFLAVMVLLASENIIERAQSFQNMRTLVKHDALGLLTHSGQFDRS